MDLLTHMDKDMEALGPSFNLYLVMCIVTSHVYVLVIVLAVLAVALGHLML